MESALIVSTNEKIAATLMDTLSRLGISKIIIAYSSCGARQLLSEQDYDLCIINSPLADESEEALALSVATKGISQVLLIVKAERFEKVSERVENCGVLTVSKPVKSELLWGALKAAQAAYNKLRSVQNENRLLLRKIEEIKIIDRAKCILISHFSMSEPEAHRCIEKQAMDMRTTKRAVAEEILKTYEN